MTEGPSGGSGEFAALLEVQDHDTMADQIRHRRAALPDRAELGRVDAGRADLDARVAHLRSQRDEMAARQQALEEQIGAGRARRVMLEQQMYGGQITAARDLQAMDEEVRHLAAHVTELEDRELEVMEVMEPVEGALQEADVERDALDSRAAVLRRSIVDAELQLDGELAVQEEARRVAAARVSPDLLARYDNLRRKLGGTGAARLAGNSCSGCHLALPAMEVDRIRKAPPDAVVTCEQCGRILVR